MLQFSGRPIPPARAARGADAAAGPRNRVLPDRCTAGSDRRFRRPSCTPPSRPHRSGTLPVPSCGSSCRRRPAGCVKRVHAGAIGMRVDEIELGLHTRIEEPLAIHRMTAIESHKQRFSLALNRLRIRTAQRVTFLFSQIVHGEAIRLHLRHEQASLLRIQPDIGGAFEFRKRDHLFAVG